MLELVPWLALTLSAIGLLYTVLNGHSKVSSSRIGSLEESSDMRFEAMSSRSGVVENRLTAIEVDMRHLPDKDQTHRLELSMAQMQTEIRALAQAVRDLRGEVEQLNGGDE